MVGLPGNLVIADGGAYTSHFTSFTVTFNEDVANAGGGAGIDDVTNPLNYLLLRPGTNAAYDTASCQAFATNGNLPLGDDVRVPTGPVNYNNNGGSGPFVATVTVNGGTAAGPTASIACWSAEPPPSSTWRAIRSTAGGTVPLPSASSLPAVPATGFAPGIITHLPEQPASRVYADLGSLWIEIPSLGVRSTIVGVPVGERTWDVTWLYDQVGWLEGTAYPTWDGNSVLTAHAYTADGLPGPFSDLGSLAYNDLVIVHLNGVSYTYALRTNALASEGNTCLPHPP